MSRASAQEDTAYKCTVASFNHIAYAGRGPSADAAAERARDECIRAERNPGFCQNPAVCEPIDD